ncbi:hypothetical protein L228DRAFT_244013 [Xylona heveae TC161]|uniref:Uncharacterized protein n=1 Tax=Xylona heveae (strain CBS 132557 / TC161) TaxID=1328760 RepID=A0A161TGE3_XYLHT|nr:hypothetical protein L228DRAFT_244013 [Xylona heveae TC161]KZF25217.1 hypothetical protein L228DRAFT_244013 [Xylona heveae TC161]
MPFSARPVERFARATAKCGPEAALYGKCIVADYNHVHKDKCLTQFLRLKDCYLVRWLRWHLSEVSDEIDMAQSALRK